MPVRGHWPLRTSRTTVEIGAREGKCASVCKRILTIPCLDGSPKYHRPTHQLNALPVLDWDFNSNCGVKWGWVKGTVVRTNSGCSPLRGLFKAVAVCRKRNYSNSKWDPQDQIERIKWRVPPTFVDGYLEWRLGWDCRCTIYKGLLITRNTYDSLLPSSMCIQLPVLVPRSVIGSQTLFLEFASWH